MEYLLIYLLGYVFVVLADNYASGGKVTASTFIFALLSWLPIITALLMVFHIWLAKAIYKLTGEL